MKSTFFFPFFRRLVTQIEQLQKKKLFFFLSSGFDLGGTERERTRESSTVPLENPPIDPFHCTTPF
jgi:hypothetical protein